MTSWFAWQRGPSGCIPVVFAERPEPGQGMAGIVKSSLRELPAELDGAPLAKIAAWAVATLPLPVGGIGWYDNWGEPPAPKSHTDYPYL